LWIERWKGRQTFDVRTIVRSSLRTAGERGALVLLEGGAGDLRSGPEIRGWELARALAASMPVTVAAEEADGAASVPGVRVVRRRRAGLVREAAAHDAVLAPWVPAYLLAGLARPGTLTVADLYDPVHAEAATLGDDADKAFLESARRAREMQLRFADIVLCASEGQRRAIEGELAALRGKRGHPALVLVPFGIGADPPEPSRRPLRTAFPAIGAGDPVVLWWGSIWRWMDADTAIRAAALAAERRPGLRLVLTAGSPPRADAAGMGSTEAARDLARELGLLDRVVFFVNDWIAYDRRHEYLLEADVGIALHRDAREAELSARARTMDFLWSRLPSVLSEGTELGARFAAAGFAREVAVGDAEGAAAALLELLDGDESARRAAEGLVAEYRWETVVAPLAALLAGTDRGPTARRAGGLSAAAGALGYYAQRLRQEIVTRRGRVAS
jgi:glycosyltransferase involved in cell wall biosynthesis